MCFFDITDVIIWYHFLIVLVKHQLGMRGKILSISDIQELRKVPLSITQLLGAKKSSSSKIKNKCKEGKRYRMKSKQSE